MPDLNSQVEIVRDWLKAARRITVLTGAGISAESGISVFRGAEGLWRKRRAETLATPEAFTTDPVLVWEWYNCRREKVAAAQPNQGHLALAELERQTEDFTLVTQNVDGLHDRAGSARPLKLHGDIWELRCQGCGAHSSNYDVPVSPIPPACPCGGLLRPGVIWFGEPLPQDVLDEAIRASARVELFLVVGTSSVVYPAAALPQLAKQQGARLVEINLEETPLTPLADLTVLGKSGSILPLLTGPEVRV